MTFKTKAVVQCVIAEMLGRKTFGFQCSLSDNGSISVTTEKLRKIFARKFPHGRAPDFGVMPMSEDGVMIYIGPNLIEWVRGLKLPKGGIAEDNIFRRISPQQTGLVAYASYGELGEWISEQINRSVHLQGSLEDVSVIMLTFPEPPGQVQIAA